MFELRLGLALHKTRAEIRAMPYEEFKDWQTFYLIEPWGWWNEELNTARMLALLHNTHAKKAKPLKEFMRDPGGELLKHFAEPPEPGEETNEEKKRRILDAVKKDFGIK